jgi:CheY-like chemotaxis protein
MESANKRVLCVDDDAATLTLRRVVLEGSGYCVLTADSGEKALSILAEGTPVDAVLIDYWMPGMKGDELAEKLRKAYPHLRIIAVSAEEDPPPSLLKSVHGHLLKGPDPAILLSTVASVLAQVEDQPGNFPSPSSETGQPRTVLCVEDEQLQLQLRKVLLESAGFQVLLARSADAAMEAFRLQHVDAVVMDYWLSGKNGTAVAEEMKKIRPKIPIVMLSGFSSLPGEGVVVDAWLRKGDVEPEQVVSEVRRLIGLRNEAKQTTTT